MVLPAQGMGHGVAVAHIGFGKRTPCQECSPQHIGPGGHIAAVRVGLFQVFLNQLDGLQGIGAGLPGGGAANIGFYGVGQGVYAGGGGHVLGQGTGHLRIQNRDLGN